MHSSVTILNYKFAQVYKVCQKNGKIENFIVNLSQFNVKNIQSSPTPLTINSLQNNSTIIYITNRANELLLPAS